MQSILDRAPLKADHRLRYGSLPLQFGDLWLPPAASGRRAPVVVMIHGGWWKNAYSLDYAGFACRALCALGIAVWSLEYRRVGDVGGGFPGTLADVAQGVDHVRTLAGTFPLDAERVIAAGHSAGGHLAFWLAGRHHVPPDSPVAVGKAPLPLLGVVGLAGAVDLRLIAQFCAGAPFSSGRPAVENLIGGLPPEFPERFRAANPGELLPFGIPQRLIQGSEDSQIPPEVPRRWVQGARRQGDSAELTVVPGADHFSVMDPASAAWPVCVRAIRELLSL